MNKWKLENLGFTTGFRISDGFSDIRIHKIIIDSYFEFFKKVVDGEFSTNKNFYSSHYFKDNIYKYSFQIRDKHFNQRSLFCLKPSFGSKIKQIIQRKYKYNFNERKDFVLKKYSTYKEYIEKKYSNEEKFNSGSINFFIDSLSHVGSEYVIHFRERILDLLNSKGDEYKIKEEEIIQQVKRDYPEIGRGGIKDNEVLFLLVQDFINKDLNNDFLMYLYNNKIPDLLEIDKSAKTENIGRSKFLNGNYFEMTYDFILAQLIDDNNKLSNKDKLFFLNHFCLKKFIFSSEDIKFKTFLLEQYIDVFTKIIDNKDYEFLQKENKYIVKTISSVLKGINGYMEDKSFFSIMMVDKNLRLNYEKENIVDYINYKKIKGEYNPNNLTYSLERGIENVFILNKVEILNELVNKLNKKANIKINPIKLLSNANNLIIDEKDFVDDKVLRFNKNIKGVNENDFVIKRNKDFYNISIKKEVDLENQMGVFLKDNSINNLLVYLLSILHAHNYNCLKYIDVNTNLIMKNINNDKNCPNTYVKLKVKKEFEDVDVSNEIKEECINLINVVINKKMENLSEYLTTLDIEKMKNTFTDKKNRDDIADVFLYGSKIMYLMTRDIAQVKSTYEEDFTFLRELCLLEKFKLSDSNNGRNKVQRKKI